MVVFTSGNLIIVEGNNPDEWLPALPWQGENFIKAINLGSMKSMGIPNPITLTEPFTNGDFQYQFKIINDWNPCYIINMTTGKVREIKYLPLFKTKDNSGQIVSDNTISQIRKM